MTKHANLKFVLQLNPLFLEHGWTISEDVGDLLDGKLALLSEEQHHTLYGLHRHTQDLRVIAHHSLQTTYGGGG